AAIVRAGRAADFALALAIQRDREALKELVFGEPVVEAVARIKIILQHEGLIRSATVRRPQMGISDAERQLMLDSYHALKDEDFRSVEGDAEPKQSRALI